MWIEYDKNGVKGLYSGTQVFLQTEYWWKKETLKFERPHESLCWVQIYIYVCLLDLKMFIAEERELEESLGERTRKRERDGAY